MTSEDRNALKEAQRKAQKKNKIFLGIKIGVFIAVIGMLVFLIVHKGNAKGRIRTDFIQTGVIDEYFSSDLTFIRTEYEITSPGEGKVIPKVNEGDKVSAGSIIAYIVKEGYEEELKKLRELESKIAVANNASSYVGSETNVELVSINEEIANLRRKITMLTLSGDISLYSRYKQELETALEIKNNILLNIEAPNEYVKELKAEYDTVYKGLRNYMKEVISDKSGVVSFYIDGNQNVSSLNAMKISEYQKNSSEDLLKLDKSVISFSNNEMKYMYGQNVSHGDVVARITPDVSYYIAVRCAENQLSSVSEGTNILLKSANRDYSVTARVVEVFKDGKDSAIILEASCGISSSLSFRSVEGDVILSYTEGIKVVKRCLSEIDSAGVTARIAIVRSGYVEFIYVNILASDGEYVIINSKSNLSQGEEGISVRINDLYVINQEDVKEGQIIE